MIAKREAEKQQPIHPQLTVRVEQTKLHILAAVESNGKRSGHAPEHIKKIIGDLLVVLGEVFNNVLFHAHKADPEKKLDLRWSIRHQVLEMIFKDSGNGFDVQAALDYDPTHPDNLEIEGRRGVMLIRHYSQPEWSEGGTKLAIRKNLNIAPKPVPTAAANAA